MHIKSWLVQWWQHSLSTNDFWTMRSEWVEFVASPLCYERFSLGTLVVPFAQKPKFDLISVNLISMNRVVIKF